MKISLKNISKKYNQNWIFKSLNLEINDADKLVVLGANGSGKSTFMQIVAGYVSPTNGVVSYSANNKIIENEIIYQSLSISAPSLELIEEFTLEENILFFTQLKPLMNNLTVSKLASLCYLDSSINKPLFQFSSGMKQRLKLGLAITANVPLLLLDEPTSNLDKQGIEWYKNLINDYTKNKTCIVCSNQVNDEYFFCKQQINIDDYK